MNKDKLLLLEISVGIIIGFFLMSHLIKEQQNFENFALGEETKTYLATDDSDLIIHITNLDSASINVLKKGWNLRGKKDIMLVLGNSQTHSINQIKTGQVTYVEKLHNLLEDSIDVLALTFPNANLQELYLGLEFMKSTLPIKFVVLPVFMDDLREGGIREKGFEIVASTKFVLPDTSALIAKRLQLEIQNFSEDKAPSNDQSALYETMQAKSEEFLDNKISDLAPIWAKRPDIRGQMFLSLYQLRNRVFGINAQTKRKLIPTRYNNNLAALEEILRRSKVDKIKVLTYIPPIRSDVEIPYDIEEYAKFKDEVEILVNKYFKNFKNLENIIPGKLWGVKASTDGSGKPELDFMHFQYKGHEKLYSALKTEINKLINDF